MTDSTCVAQPRDNYIGRFAPSPSGSLHFGSLVCALASFLDAHWHRGQWLVRVEDIDPPREQAGAREAILQCLAAHHLHWDGPVLQQSSRAMAYEQTLHYLAEQDLIYRCNCTRRRLQSLGGVYDGHCRRHPPSAGQPAALRLKVAELPPAFSRISTQITFNDAIQGRQAEDVSAGGDFIIHRKDGLFAYQLAVVVDDIFQQVSHVVRGSDLLDTTARQIYLFRLLGFPEPRFSHIPVVVDQQHQKLSKQNHAPAVDNRLPGSNLWHACNFLGLAPPGTANEAAPQTLLQWAITQWNPEQVPQQLSQTGPAGFTANSATMSTEPTAVAKPPRA